MQVPSKLEAWIQLRSESSRRNRQFAVASPKTENIPTKNPIEAPGGKSRAQPTQPTAEILARTNACPRPGLVILNTQRPIREIEPIHGTGCSSFCQRQTHGSPIQIHLVANNPHNAARCVPTKTASPARGSTLERYAAILMLSLGFDFGIMRRHGTGFEGRRRQKEMGEGMGTGKHEGLWGGMDRVLAWHWDVKHHKSQTKSPASHLEESESKRHCRRYGC